MHNMDHTPRGVLCLHQESRVHLFIKRDDDFASSFWFIKGRVYGRKSRVLLAQYDTL